MTYQVLFLLIGHFLNNRPKPALKLIKAIIRLGTLVIEGSVRYEGCHVDVSNTIQE